MRPCCHSSAQSWTLTSLIGSYLDLALAYLLLIGSTLVFLASKFLSLFGLALPCPCAGGLFGNSDCVQTHLFDSTRTRIGSLHGSIRTRFPFDAIFGEHIGPEPDGAPLRLTGPEGDGDGEGRVLVGNRVGSFVGRRVRKRRVSGWRKGKSSVSPPSPMRLSWQGEELGDNFGCQSKEESFAGVVGSEDGVSVISQSPLATEFFSVKDTSSATQDVSTSNGSMEIITKNLEQELEESQAAYAALYLELEKERSAAATAADEAMAMILRLQSEKAAIEMESRQFQRIIEEKSAYDEEEMEILKEIIVRREREKHVLEKEVEAYKKMMFSGDITGEKPDFLFDSYDDPTVMLKNIFDSIGKKKDVKSKIKWQDDGVGIRYPDLSDIGDECNIEFQEKGVVTVDVYPSGHCQGSSFGDIRFQSNGPRGPLYCKESSCIHGEDVGNENKVENLEMKLLVDEPDTGDSDADQRGSCSAQSETESSVLDVHVIEDKKNLDNKEIREGSDAFDVVHALNAPEKDGRADELPGTSNVDRSDKTLGDDDLSTKTAVKNWVGVEQDIQRSCSDMTQRCKLMGTLSDRASHIDQRRSSMSAVDSERFKLEAEIVTLRKRLKTIQQGRENLSFPMEYREKEAFELQLLEEIACQLQEIRRITEPGKRIRQASLPPLSSKVNSKKRRCRSVSAGLHESA